MIKLIHDTSIFFKCFPIPVYPAAQIALNATFSRCCKKISRITNAVKNESNPFWRHTVTRVEERQYFWEDGGEATLER